MAYTTTEGKDVFQLESELIEVYYSYLEYNCPDYGGKGFLNMVNQMAEDDFYKLHLVAKEYKNLSRPTPIES